MVKKANKRSEIDNDFKWALCDIYATDEDWEKDFEYLKNNTDEIDSLAGTLGKSSDNLLNALSTIDKISLVMEKLYVYAKMKMDEDNGVAIYQAMHDRAMALSVEISAHLSFLEPQLLAIDEEILKGFIKENKGLEPYDFNIYSLIRLKDHILDQKSERILAMTHEISSGPRTIFSMLNNVDMQFPIVNDEDGNKVQLTHGRYGDLMSSKNRDVRKESFDGLYKEYEDMKNTIAATLNGSVKAGLFYSRIRDYNSTLESSLDGDNVPLEVYNNLIKVINDRLPSLHKYFDLKKKALGLEELHMYDIYAPISEEDKEKIEFSAAKDILIEGLAPLGSEYQGLLNTAFESRWMDVYENEGKTSGAYSWGAYGVHPFVLLNYQENLNSVFTIAHELGHALHSYYADNNLPYSKAQYTIFVAEVASTVNEVLLNFHLLNSTQDKQKKISIIAHFLEQFRTTLFRQTMFAEYEQIIHGSAAAGEPLTAEYLTKSYYELNKKYHENVVNDDFIGYEWSRIPHFYNAFYVYKYATGFSAAVAIAKGIINGGDTSGYINMLKSGGSDYPIELLKIAGVDMSSPKPIEDCLDVFDEMLAMLGELLEG